MKSPPARPGDGSANRGFQHIPDTTTNHQWHRLLHRLPLWFVLVLLQATICTSSILAQSNLRLAGTVVDDDGAPVPHAEVSIAGSSFRTVTDAAGHFNFVDIPPGRYKLHISAAGYDQPADKSTEIVCDVTRRLRVVLNRRLYQVSGVVVRDERPPPGSGAVVVDRSQIDSLHPQSTAEVLESIEGVYVEQSSSTSQALVRIRGGGANQVLVLVDGQRINSSSSGTADLNSIPPAMIERIELYKAGASARFGPDALAGVVNIITQSSQLLEPTSLEIEAARGQWNTQQYQVTAVKPVTANLVSRFAFTDLSSHGDFDYTYYVSPGDTTFTGPRINNHSHRRSIFAGGRYHPGLTQIGYSLQVYRAGNGMPGRASQQNEDGCRDDDRVLTSVRLERPLSSRLRGRFNAGYSRFRQFFKDRSGAPSSQYESRFTEDRLDVQLHTEYRWGGHQVLRLGGQLRSDRLDHKDFLHESNATGRTARTTWSAFGDNHYPVDLSGTGVIDDITINGALRYDHAVTRPADTLPRYPWEEPRHEVSTESWSPHVGVSVTRGERWRLTARGNWGRSLRLPSINALFWQGDARSEGNPDLKPERSEHVDGGIELAGSGRGFTLSAGVTFYHNKVTDLVVWAQTGPQGVFKPVNLGAARITGHEDFVSLSAFHGLISLRYGNSVTHARNKQPGANSYDKWLTYTPSYVTTFTLRVEHAGVSAAYKIRQVGRRYALSGNERWYDAYALHDLTLSARIKLTSSWRLRLEGRIRNLTDKQYVLIAQHPMPGREHGLSLQLSYTPKERNHATD